jgi:hypothetical protein
MKRQLDTATDAARELQSHDGADSTPEVLIAPESFKGNDVGLEAPGMLLCLCWNGRRCEGIPAFC